jgi:hypothetical protein
MHLFFTASVSILGGLSARSFSAQCLRAHIMFILCFVMLHVHVHASAFLSGKCSVGFWSGTSSPVCSIIDARHEINEHRIQI